MEFHVVRSISYKSLKPFEKKLCILVNNDETMCHA